MPNFDPPYIVTIMTVWQSIMLTSCVQQYFETDDESIVEKTLDSCIQIENENNEQLYEFIKEFIESEEFENYLKKKREIVQTEAATQYSKDDFKEEKRVWADKYPLTTQSRKMFAFATQFEKFVRNEKKRERRIQQEKGIAMIKEKLECFREAYRYAEEKSAKRRRNEFKKYVREFCIEQNIDISRLKTDTKRILQNKIVRYKKSLLARERQRKRNIIGIIKKIRQELTTQKQKQFRKTKKEIPQAVETSEVNLVNKVDSNSLQQSISSVSLTVSEQQKTCRESISSIMKIDNNNSVRSKTITRKKSQVVTKKKSILEQRIIPNVPICNTRKKITMSDQVLDKLFEQFKTFEATMENQLLKRTPEIPVERIADHKFLCTPENVNFESYQRGKTYTKPIIITNISPYGVKFRLQEIEFPDEYDKLCFKVTPLMDVLTLPAGCKTRFFLVFTPEEDTYFIRGKLKLSTYDLRTFQTGIVHVHVSCIPKCVNLKVHSSSIDFGTVPFWSLPNCRPKLMNLTNNGSISCFLVLRRHRDPLGISEPLAIIKDDREFIMNLVEGIFDDVFSVVRIDSSLITLNAKEKINLRVNLKNVDREGDLFEKYLLDVYEGSKNGNLIGTHEFLITVNVSGHIIKLTPEVVDFGVCFVNSTYQTGLHVYNNTSNTLTIYLKFPPQIADYLKCDISTMYVPAGDSKKVLLKFFPTPSLCKDQSKFYNKFTSIVEFPVYVFVMTKNYSAIPPAKATAVAIVGQPKTLKMYPKNYLNFHHGRLNLGECSIYETIYLDLELLNDSSSRQIYGIMDVPSGVTIDNSEFGMVKPGELLNLRLCYHPDLTLFKNYPIKQDFYNKTFEFELNLETISHRGMLKTELNSKNVRKSFDMMFKELRGKFNYAIYEDIENCKTAIKNELYPFDRINNDVLVNKWNKMQQKEPSEHLKFTVSVSRPLLEFSHQHIRFSPTVCGSFSYQEIELRAFEGLINAQCDRQKPITLEYEAFFRIIGDCDEVKVEPSCGVLKNGESKKIIFLVKPSTPVEVLTEMKQAILDDTTSRASIRTKNTKRLDIKSVQSRRSTLDVYQCEMLFWRTMNPYEIKSRILCEIRYRGNAKNGGVDRIYVDTVCGVIRPDFLTNLKSQRIYFGCLSISTNRVETVIFHNISYNQIELKPSLLDPGGPFKICSKKPFLIPSEHFMKLQIKYEPHTVGSFEEYLEIKSNGTILSLVLEGEAKMPDNIQFNPNFLIFRMETSTNIPAEAVIQITSSSSEEIRLRFEKVCEMNGIFRMQKDVDSSTEKSAQNQANELVLENFSDMLSQEEQFCIQNYCEKCQFSNFFINNTNNGEVSVEKGKPGIVRICCGKQGIQRRLSKIGQEDKKSIVQKNKFAMKKNMKLNIAKYNVTLAEHFLRDFIFICCKK